MAHVWIHSTSGWDAQKLDAGECVLAERYLHSGDAAQSSGAEQTGSTRATYIRIIRVDAGGTRAWVLAAPGGSAARVNGLTPLAGLRVLADRDEIRIGATQYFFSTETLATVMEFPPTDRPVFCGRCRQQIAAGTPAVCCPNCGVWYNESPDLPCWTYADKCTFCGHPTALDTGFSWTPEERR